LSIVCCPTDPEAEMANEGLGQVAGCCMYLNGNLDSLWIIILKIDSHQSLSFYNWRTKLASANCMTMTWWQKAGTWEIFAGHWPFSNMGKTSQSPESRDFSDQVDQLLIMPVFY